MNTRKLFTALLLLAGLMGCQAPVHRNPSSIVTSKDWEELRILKQRKAELAALSVHFQKKNNESQLKKIVNEQNSLDKKIADIESRITSFEEPGNQSIVHESSDWRVEKERIELTKLEYYS